MVGENDFQLLKKQFFNEIDGIFNKFRKLDPRYKKAFQSIGSELAHKTAHMKYQREEESKRYHLIADLDAYRTEQNHELIKLLEEKDQTLKHMEKNNQARMTLMTEDQLRVVLNDYGTLRD